MTFTLVCKEPNHYDTFPGTLYDMLTAIVEGGVEDGVTKYTVEPHGRYLVVYRGQDVETPPYDVRYQQYWTDDLDPECLLERVPPLLENRVSFPDGTLDWIEADVVDIYQHRVFRICFENMVHDSTHVRPL